ncbi:hypothetical protein [Lapillicoccus sp.]|uniref:hypothetical protein n=1 Tax=Lapillicoccus sp. TaxID=1909287 RepID=UPI003264F329
MTALLPDAGGTTSGAARSADDSAADGVVVEVGVGVGVGVTGELGVVVLVGLASAVVRALAGATGSLVEFPVGVPVGWVVFVGSTVGVAVAVAPGVGELVSAKAWVPVSGMIPMASASDAATAAVTLLRLPET